MELLKKTDGWKTAIAAAVFIGLSSLSLFGVEIDGIDAVINQTTDAAIILVNTVFLILRHVTTGAPGWRR